MVCVVVKIGSGQSLLVCVVSGEGVQKDCLHFFDLCVSSLRRGHANLPCIVPILTDDPRRESNDRFCRCRLLLLLLLPAACCLLQQAAPAATVAAATAAEDHCLPLADCRQLLPAPAAAYARPYRFGFGNTGARNKQTQVFYLGCCRTRPQTQCTKTRHCIHATQNWRYPTHAATPATPSGAPCWA